MRCPPPFVIALLFCCLITAPVWGQQLQCEPCQHGFGKVQIGDSSSFSFQLSNTGTNTLVIDSISVQGTAFTLGNFPLPADITPGASVLLPVIFTPTALGYAEGNLKLISNAEDSPLVMNLIGNGVTNANLRLGISPASLNFGNVPVGSTATQHAILTATNGSVTISSDRSTSSEFAILGLTLPVTITSGASLPVTIQFAPSSSGTDSARAGFISDAQDSPTLVQLTGTGNTQNSHSVDLSWDSSGGDAVAYDVFRGTVNGGPYQIVATEDASTSYTDSTVVSGMTYYYVVTAINAQGEQSGYSNVAEAVIPGS
jgi:hypothetical protein